MNRVLVFALDGRFEISEGKIRHSARRALTILKKKNSLLEIYLIGNKQMRFLNKKFRGYDKTTNILSFPEPKDFPHPELKYRTTRMKRGQTRKFTPLGEIYLNVPYIKKEARQKGTHYSLLITQLLVHGLLHLLGFRHGKKCDRIRMEKMEQKLLKYLMTK